MGAQQAVSGLGQTNADTRPTPSAASPGSVVFVSSANSTTLNTRVCVASAASKPAAIFFFFNNNKASWCFWSTTSFQPAFAVSPRHLHYTHHHSDSSTRRA